VAELAGLDRVAAGDVEREQPGGAAAFLPDDAGLSVPEGHRAGL
jgi:hypothetical protein